MKSLNLNLAGIRSSSTVQPLWCCAAVVHVLLGGSFPSTYIHTRYFKWRDDYVYMYISCMYIYTVETRIHVSLFFLHLLIFRA